MKRFAAVAVVGIGLLATACAGQMDGGMAQKSLYDRLGQTS